jgi:hypothetical protein
MAWMGSLGKGVVGIRLAEWAVAAVAAAAKMAPNWVERWSSLFG